MSPRHYMDRPFRATTTTGSMRQNRLHRLERLRRVAWPEKLQRG